MPSRARLTLSKPTNEMKKTILTGRVQKLTKCTWHTFNCTKSWKIVIFLHNYYWHFWKNTTKSCRKTDVFRHFGQKQCFSVVFSVFQEARFPAEYAANPVSLFVVLWKTVKSLFCRKVTPIRKRIQQGRATLSQLVSTGLIGLKKVTFWLVRF